MPAIIDRMNNDNPQGTESDNEPQEQPDTRLVEEELPKPGSSFKPGEPNKTPDEPSSNQAQAGVPAKNDQAGKKTTDELPEDDNGEDQKPKHTAGKIIKELLITAVVTAGIVFVINSFIFQAFYVSGSSMEPDFHNSDYLIISKLALTWNSVKSLFGAHDNLDVKRGDVLIFRYPNAPDTFFIKRAIGLPGERVTVKDGVVTIYNKEHPEGMVLDEKTYIDPNYKTEGTIDEVVQPQHFFVIGDNRSPNGSFDSRYWGQLDQKFITGIANVRLLPLNTFEFVSVPDYKQQ